MPGFTHKVYDSFLSMSTFKIALQRVQSEDWRRLARLEVEAFGDEGFSAVAYGSRRFDEDVLEERAKEMDITNDKPGQTTQ